MGGPEPLAPDVNNDGNVDILDLLMVWKNIEKGDLQFDVNGDGTVDKMDIVEVAKNLDDPEERLPRLLSFPMLLYALTGLYRRHDSLSRSGAVFAQYCL